MLGKNKNKIIINNSGFTLIELLVSIFILALISGIFMVNYKSASKRSGLNLAKQKLASDIRLAQNYSLGSKTYNGTNTPTGGWGIRFVLSGTSYVIFADKNADKNYDSGEAIETKNLPAGVTINLVKINNIQQPSANIIFFPPDPIVYINTLSNANAMIALKEDTNNTTAAVTVNSFGLIDTE